MYLCCNWPESFYHSNHCQDIGRIWGYGLYNCGGFHCKWAGALTVYCTIFWMCHWRRVDGKWRGCACCIWWFEQTCDSIPYTIPVAASSARTWGLSRRCILLTFQVIGACSEIIWQIRRRFLDSAADYWDTGGRCFGIYSH